VRETAMYWGVKDRLGIPLRRWGFEHAFKGNWAKEIFDETLLWSMSFLRKHRRDILADEECTGDINVANWEGLRVNRNCQ